MGHTSFDLEINGVIYTFAPISTDDDCIQYSVMTEDLIFRMTFDNGDQSYKIEEKSNMPDDVISLETYLSNAIINNEKKEENSLY